MKKIGFFCLLITIVLIIFYQPFLNFLAHWSLQTYAVSKWGKPLEYEKLSFNGQQLVLSQPRFENGSAFAAEQIMMDFHFNWWNRHLHINVDIHQPHWHFQAPFASQGRNWEKLLTQKEKWIKIHPHFRIKSGLLTWTTEDFSQHHQVHFDLETNSQKGGFVKLLFDPEDPSTNYMILTALSAVEGMEMNFNCQKLHCPSFFALMQFLEVDMPLCLITSGFLQGELKAVFPNTRRPYLEGEVIVEHLAFNHMKIDLQGQLEQVRFKVEKNQSAYEFNDQVPTFIGQIDILKPASLTYFSPLRGWTIDQIQGSIKLNDIETALIDLEAQVGHPKQLSHWCLYGKTNLNAQRSLNFDLNLFCSSLGKPEGKIHLSLYQPQKGSKRAEVQLQKVSHIECDFLQTLLAAYWPIFNEIKLEDGELNAYIEADVTEQGIKELHVKQFQALHVCPKFQSWNTQCYFGAVHGHGKIYLEREDFWQSINAGLHLEDGEILFEGMTPHLPLTDIQAHLLIQQGHIEHSLITLQLAGLKGKMDVEWGDHKQFLTFKLDGVVQDLADLLPATIQEGLRENFYPNRLMVLANIKRHNQQIELGGSLHIQRDHTDQMDLIHFGCELKKNHQNPTPSLIPFGWFHGHHLPLEKFLSPFIFRHGILHMKGEAEFKGSFDDHYLTVKYAAKDFKIENEDLCIEIKHLCSPIPGQLIGLHQFDLKDYSHQGTLPIQQGSYFEKNSGLVFQDIQGVMNFKDQSLSIKHLETYCEGIYFAGDLELDYSHPSPRSFKLAIHCPTLSGKLSHIQHLLAYLDQPSLLHKIPLEGEISAREEGLKLDFTFTPQDYKLQTTIQGIVTEGFLPFKDADMALKGIYMDVDYDHQQQLLEFSDIQGTLLVGKPRRVEEYEFTGDHIRLHQLVHPNIEIDIAIKDQKHELLRLVGYTKEEQSGIKSLYLNQSLSHISYMYPLIWQCRLKDWSHIEQFEMSSYFDLSGCLQDLKRFRQTGLGCLSHGIIDKISHYLPIEGRGTFAVSYHPDQSFTYQLEGIRIKQGNDQEHYGLLKGSKLDKKWIIDQLQWDDLKVYAELQQTTDKWKIPFLGLNAGQTLLLGLNGEFCPKEGLLRAKLNFCEANLAKLDHWEALQPFVKKWWPKGHLKATGEMEWCVFKKDFKVSLKAEIDNLAFRNYPVQILKPFHINFQSDQSCHLQDVYLDLMPQNSQSNLHLQHFEYRFDQNCLDNLQLTFQIPSLQIEKLGQSLHHHFPDFLDASMRDLLIATKKQGQLKGTLLIENDHTHQRFLRLVLEDGIYHFKKRAYDLKQFRLQIAHNEVRFSTFSQHERCRFQVIGQAEWPACQKGQWTLKNIDVSQSLYQPLVIHWENHPQQGLNIRSMQGEFSGCSFGLTENQDSLNNTERPGLQGQITVDVDHLSPFLSSSLAEKIQKLKISSVYSLRGQFWLSPEKEINFLDAFSFKGLLTSQEAILKGYQVKHLQANLQYVPGRLDIQNLVIQDPALNIQAASLMTTLDRPKDEWTLFIPHLTVKNLKFSLLRDTESTYMSTNSKFRSLIVKRIELQDFSGKLTQQQTWQAQGSLHFLNSSRKNLQNPLLAIPAEIILRLGLDPQILNPVTGIVFFNMQKERFYLTRFKDVYSEGRGSKFYLADSPDPSWMDYKGNLSIQVGMKQYNFIFKIAELFTVSIQGNIKKPRYTLQKQAKTSHKGQAPAVFSNESKL